MSGVLENKVAVVTGSGRGIGRAIALLLAEEGASVVVNDLGSDQQGVGASSSPADDVVAEIVEHGGKAVANYDSVAVPEGGQRIIETAVSHFGRIDILVNVAGVVRDRMIFNMSDDEWDVVVKTHLYGHFYCTRPACTYMREQKGGRIVNVASLSAFGNMGQANYSAAKAGIIGFTRTVARDVGRYGVTCNAIIPTAPTRLGWSPQLKAAWETRAAQGDAVAARSLRTMQQTAPEDNAPLIAYLASDAAAHINGCLFSIRGGAIALYGEPVQVKTIYKEGAWKVAELMDFMPRSLGEGLVNPAPPKA